MRRKLTLLLLLLIPLTPLLDPFMQHQVSGADSQFAGPSVDVLSYKFLPLLGYDEELSALLSGEVDMIPNLESFDEAAYLESTNNVDVYRSRGGSTRLSCVFFNMRRNPCNDSAVRQAVSSVVDRTYVCDTVFDGWVDPVTTFVPPMSGSWTNAAASTPTFDTERARRILDDAGYLLNDLGWRGAPGSNTTMRTLSILTPTWSASPILWQIGYMMSYYMNATGIPTQQIALTTHSLLEKAMWTRDFDICVLDISLAQAPFGLYALLHSSRDQAGTSAYPGIHDSTLDSLLETLWYSNDRIQAQNAALGTQTLLSQQLPYVPVCSTPRMSAVRSDWVGLVNLNGFGAVNMWTYLGVHMNSTAFGGSFIQTALGNLSTLNPCLASGTNEWSVLQQIYSPLFYLDPSTLEEMPILAKNWTVEPWVTPQGSNGTRIVFVLRENVVWQDYQPFSSGDVKFCIDYLKANNVPRYANICTMILNVTAPSATRLEVYLNETGYRQLYDLAWLTFLPQHVWRDITDYAAFEPWKEANGFVPGLTKLVGQGPFVLKQCDLDSSATLVWNPLFYMKNPDKPALVQKSSVPETAVLGDNVTFRYTVYNHTRVELRTPDANFSVYVRNTAGSLVAAELAVYRDSGYEAEFETGRLGEGNFSCTFMALPYGVETSDLAITPAIPEFPSWAFLPLVFLAGQGLLAFDRRQNGMTHCRR